MKKIQVVVTEEIFKELSKKLLDEEISKQQFLENKIKEYLQKGEKNEKNNTSK